MKQYGDLVRNIESFTNGQGTVKLNDASDTLDVIYVTFNIKDGVFRGAKIDFKLKITDSYPSIPPDVTCLTEIYHPNLDFYEDDEDDGNVCLNLFDEQWTSECTLEDIVQGLLFLIYNPNLTDPLNSMFYGNEPDEEFEKNVRISLRGGTVDGVTFNRALSDGYESDFDHKEIEEVYNDTVDKQADTTQDRETNSEADAVKLAVNQLKDEELTSVINVVPVEDTTANERSHTNLFLRIFSHFDKIFAGYFESRQSRRTVLESSVDPEPMYAT